MTMTQKQAADLLTKKGIRPSMQRLAVYLYVHSHKTHPTVDMVYTDLSPTMPTLSKTTVYNTLKLFSAKKLVQSLTIEDDELRYDANIEPHIHLKCTKCGKIFDVPSIKTKDILFSLKNDIEKAKKPEGFSVTDIQFFVWGHCKECSKIKNT